MSQRALRPREPVIAGAVLSLAHPVYRVMEVLGDVELIEHDLTLRLVEMLAGRLDVGLPHVHRHRVDPLPLGGRDGSPEAVEALLLPVLREVQDTVPVQIRDHREVAVALRDGLLVHPEAGEPPGYGSGLDPPGLIPGDAQEVGPALDGALAEQVDGEALEQGRNLAARLGPGDSELLDPVGRAFDARNVRLDPGGELAGIEVAPAAEFAIVAGDRV